MSSILPLDKQFTNALYPFDIDRGSIYYQTWFNTSFISHIYVLKFDLELRKTMDFKIPSSHSLACLRGNSKRKAEKMVSKKNKKKMERENVKMYNQLLKVILPKAHKLFGSSSSSDSD